MSDLTPEQLHALLDGPAGKPPSGVVPNLQNPPTLDGLIVFCIIFFSIITILALSMRLYTKAFIIKVWAYEDCECPGHSPLRIVWTKSIKMLLLWAGYVVI